MTLQPFSILLCGVAKRLRLFSFPEIFWVDGLEWGLHFFLCSQCFWRWVMLDFLVVLGMALEETEWHHWVDGLEWGLHSLFCSDCLWRWMLVDSLFVLGTILTATTFNFNQMIISCIITGVSAARKMHHAMCYLSEICLSRTPQARFPSLSLSSLVCRSPADATLTC